MNVTAANREVSSFKRPVYSGEYLPPAVVNRNDLGIWKKISKGSHIRTEGKAISQRKTK